MYDLRLNKRYISKMKIGSGPADEIAPYARALAAQEDLVRFPALNCLSSPSVTQVLVDLAHSFFLHANHIHSSFR